MTRWERGAVAGTAVLVVVGLWAATASGQPYSAQIQRAIRALATGATPLVTPNFNGARMLVAIDPAIANFGLGSSTPYVFTGTASLGHDNLFLGLNSGDQVTDGIGNLGIGHSALGSLTTGINNVAVGWDALTTCATCNNTTAVGMDAFKSVTNGGDGNTGFGVSPGYSTTTGDENVAFGNDALYSNTTGGRNTAIGAFSLRTTVANSQNTALGHSAGFSNTGANNLFLGHEAGYFETGSNTFMVDNQRRASQAAERAGALLYGTMASTVAAQSLVVNGALSSARSVTATAGTATFKAGGIVCQNLTNPTDAAIQNQWNVITCSIPAATMATVGDTLKIEVPAVLAANANAKEYQGYFSLATATCSGTSATLCDSGCQLYASNTSNSGVSSVGEAVVVKTGTGTQKSWGHITTSTSLQSNTVSQSCTIDDTAATQIAAGWRNTAAAAASVTQGAINALLFPK